MAEVTFYGQLTDITGVARRSVESVSTVKELIGKIEEEFPGFSTRTFVIAVDNKIVSGDVQLDEQAKVSFLPPFSGG